LAKKAIVFSCTECGAQASKWLGRCPDCNAWNSYAQEDVPAGVMPATAMSANAAPMPIDAIDFDAAPRVSTTIPSLDRVLGGGLVLGAVTLVGGEPGIGKSTLLLQVAEQLARGGLVLYVSGEESPRQIAMRARRLGTTSDRIRLYTETSVERILQEVDKLRPVAVIIDSIQTVHTSSNNSMPGSVGQVRDSAGVLMSAAKRLSIPVFLIGHITKEGTIAGPKTLEHIVDTVLYFEGEGMLEHRLLRATKNRFGSVDEIGVFRMTEEGLIAVENPSELFLGDRLHNSSGSAVTALLEGSRPVLIEIQGLAAKAGYGTPQRVSTGYDARRLALLLAVLDKRAGLSFSQLDVFLNVVGGVRMQEPAGDLAVASALASSVYDRPVANSAIFLGEVGLGGEIRPVSQAERRLGEAAKMGMTTAYMAERGIPKRGARGIEVIGVRTINDLFRHLFHA
jgi:DNA repair protein RadA/Sms